MEINTQSNDDIDTLLKQLTPTQEHFLKKYLLEEQLSKELHNFNEPWNNRSNSLLVYIPTRTAIVLEKVE